MNEKTPPEEPKEELEEPILFEQSYIEKPKSPPWIIIAFLLFAIVGAFWKKLVTPKIVQEKPAISEVQDSETQ